MPLVHYLYHKLICDSIIQWYYVFSQLTVLAFNSSCLLSCSHFSVADSAASLWIASVALLREAQRFLRAYTDDEEFVHACHDRVKTVYTCTLGTKINKLGMAITDSWVGTVHSSKLGHTVYYLYSTPLYIQQKSLLCCHSYNIILSVTRST